MSIIIANNDSDGFYIISDTKINFNEERQPFQKHNSFLMETIKAYGLIKTIIIRGDVTICFAGDDIKIADFTVNKIRSYLCSHHTNSSPNGLLNIVKKCYDHEDNLCNGRHICDFILATSTNHGIEVYSFKDNINCVAADKAYIRNQDVYRAYIDFNEKDFYTSPTCVSHDKILVEVNTSIKFTPKDEVEQDTELLKTQIEKLKLVVDSGKFKDVDSPIIGVYYNTQRKRFEYLNDIQYAPHLELPTDGNSHSIDITPSSNGENYEILSFMGFEGIIIKYYSLNFSIVYLFTSYYLDKGISDFNNLLLPIRSETIINDISIALTQKN